MTIDSILERLALEDIFQVPGRFLVALAARRDRPRIGIELPHAHRRRVFVDAKLVVVVVGGDVFPPVRFVDLRIDAECAWLDVFEFASVRRGGGRLQSDVGSDHAERGRRGGAAGCLDELPAIEIRFPIGDLRTADIRGLLDQHKTIIRAVRGAHRRNTAQSGSSGGPFAGASRPLPSAARRSRPVLMPRTSARFHAVA